ncbi:MAG: YihY/virulence factor BrkB family protein [Polyangiaceae bacterium]|nr:YihY/virulence factor BrkB family protein [Polyangiaceae bacterium]
MRVLSLVPGSWAFIKQVGEAWLNHNASRMAAALAYYTLLSVAPLLVILVSIAGLAFGAEAARGGVAREISSLVGREAAAGIQVILANAEAPASGILSSVLGLGVLLLGASGVFGELQAALNTVWEVPAQNSSGLMQMIKDRFLSFAMVLGVAFLLLVSLVISTAIGAVGHFLESALPGGESIWQVLNFLLSLGVITCLFALIFKVLPDVRVAWREVWVGALVTAFLFSVGKFLIGLYLGKSMVSSPYGAAGSTVVFVVWVYYSAQIMLLGAEFTQVYARRLALDLPVQAEKLGREASEG